MFLSIMKRKNITIFIFFVIITSVISCESFFNQNTKEEKIIPLENEYDTLRVLFINNLYLHQDTLNKIRVSAKPHLLNSLKFSNKNNTLSFRSTANFNWLKPKSRPDVHLYFKNIKYFDIEAPLNITSVDTLNISYLRFDYDGRKGKIDINLKGGRLHFTNSVTGATTFKFSGNINRFTCSIRGISEINAKNLKITKANITQRSLLPSFINVKESLKAEIKSRGNIYYYGNPEQISVDSVDKKSTGKLIPLDK